MFLTIPRNQVSTLDFFQSSGDHRLISPLANNYEKGPYLEGNLKFIVTIDCTDEVMCCHFNETCTLLAVGLTTGSIKIYGTEGGNFLFNLVDGESTREFLPVTQVKFRKTRPGDSEAYTKVLIASYASGLLKYWHYPSSTCLLTINEDRQILTMNINHDISRLVTAGADSVIYVYDEHTKQPLNICESSDKKDVMDGHMSRIFAIQYHPDIPHVFLSGGWDDTVQYWDDRQKQSVRKIHGPHICGDALDIDPVHNHILTGSWRKRSVLQIWDFASGKLIKDVKQNPLSESQLYCVKWAGKDSILCGGSDNNMARLIDRCTLNTVGQLVDLPQGVYCLDTDQSSTQPRFAIGSNRYVFLLKAEKNSSIQ